ncbi:MAG TPA: 4,5-DOPA dioxygenase extradiol [Spirochaetia bacterium]|nr:4,5-DOPA dioxygenase extradiol [Spirochaetia bacterium]
MSAEHRMPLLFVGHGSPLNALEENQFTRGWKEIAREIPRPAAVLCISAHWETLGSLVTAADLPETLHDFDGFPRELYEVRYAAHGCSWLTRETAVAGRRFAVGIDREWGLDHGCWAVLRRMYPGADIPVVELSLNRSMPALLHYELGRALAPLREQGVLIIASGNLVHNLGAVTLPPDADFNTPYALPWAEEANERFKSLIDSGSDEELVYYHALGPEVEMAVPTPEHFLPLLYVLGLRRREESVSWFNDEAVAGSLTMTSFLVS